MCPRAAMRLSCAGVNLGNIFSTRELVTGSPLRGLDIDVTYSVAAPDKPSLESFSLASLKKNIKYDAHFQRLLQEDRS